MAELSKLGKLYHSRGKPCCRHRFGVPMIAQMNLFRVPMIDHRKRFDGQMIDHRKQFGGQMIDHRKRFDGEMIALMNGKPVYFSDDRSTEKSAGQKSDHLPAKPFPMIDHRNAK